MKSKRKRNIDLIRCGDHKMAPWSILCTHLINGESKEWLTLKSSNPEVDYDFLCPACMEKRENNEDDLDLLRPICIHCVRNLQKKYGIIVPSHE